MITALSNVEEQQKRLKETEEPERATLRRRKRRKVWVREWLNRRHVFGQYDSLLTELHTEGLRLQKLGYIKITSDLFQEMVEKLAPHLQKEPLQIGLKLAVTLRFLATGNFFYSTASGLK